MSKKVLLSGSQTAIRSNVDYFGDIQKTDISVSTSTVETVLSYFPIDNAENLIEFHINPSISQWLDISHSNLYVQMKVVKLDGTNIDSDDNVSTVNLLLHSLFRDCEIIINGSVVYSSHDQYAMRSYFQCHLGYGAGRKKYELTSALYYEESGKTIDFDKNEGQKKRKELIAKSKLIELEGPLCTDLTQSKYIPNNSQVIIRLKRNPAEFVLLMPTTSTAKSTDSTTTDVSTPCPYKIVFTQCKLKILRHTLNPAVANNIQRSLETGKIGRIAVKRTEIKLYYIPSNVFSILAENIFVGQIPEKLILALLPTEVLNGKLSSNPYCFLHNNITSVSLTTDSDNGLVTHSLSLDTNAELFLECYRSLLTLVPSLDQGNGLSRDSYIHGNVFFAFDLQPRTLQENVQTIQQGSVRLAINFRSQIEKPLTVVIYAQNDAVLTFDKDRNFQYV